MLTILLITNILRIGMDCLSIVPRHVRLRLSLRWKRLKNLTHAI
jgi:hypothetical protein